MCVEENCVFDIIDERVIKKREKNLIMEVVNLASRYLESNGRRRLTMKEVSLELESNIKLKGKYNAQEGHNELDRSIGYQYWDDNSTISKIRSAFDLSSKTSTLEDIHIITI